MVRTEQHALGIPSTVVTESRWLQCAARSSVRLTSRPGTGSGSQVHRLPGVQEYLQIQFGTAGTTLHRV